MKTTPSVSNNTIVVLLVFVCAAIMSSLFIFHSHYKPEQKKLSTDNGLLFPVMREIKPFDLMTADNKKFTQQDFLQHWTLLFFGFAHCSSICPTTLSMMNTAFAPLQKKIPNLQVVLVTLDPQRDTPDSLTNYAHSFNPSFIGVAGKIQDIRKLQSQLGIFAARDSATPVDNYQIQHTASILLIAPNGKWAGIFKFGMTPQQFVQTIEESVTSLT